MRWAKLALIALLRLAGLGAGLVLGLVPIAVVSLMAALAVVLFAGLTGGVFQ